MTVHQMVRLSGLTYRVVSRWASDMERQGRIRSAGRIKNGYRTGRRVIVYYSAWKPPQDKLFHEWCVTEFWLMHGANPDDLRGPNVSICLEDMEMPRGELIYRVECFTGTQSRVQWRARLARYRGDDGKRIHRCDDDILVFVPRGAIDAAKLVDRLIGWSQCVDLRLSFTTVEWLEACGHDGRVWKGLDGQFRTLGEQPENAPETAGEPAEWPAEETPQTLTQHDPEEYATS